MALKTCSVCGHSIQVNSTDTEVSCKACGSVYDVLIHGSVSPEVALTAEKKATRVYVDLLDYDTGTKAPDTVKVGFRVLVTSALYTEPFLTALPGKPLDFYHRLNTGAWEKLATVTTGSQAGQPPQGAYVTYEITQSGKHTFYTKFEGDAYYAGCPSKIHGLTVSEYGVSPEVGVTALPALTVRVKNMVTRKLVVGASVLVNAYEGVTDETGTALFEIIPPGSYAIRVSARNYIEASKRIELREAGALVGISLMPIWVIPVGIAGVSGAIVVAHQLTKPR